MSRMPRRITKHAALLPRNPMTMLALHNRSDRNFAQYLPYECCAISLWAGTFGVVTRDQAGYEGSWVWGSAGKDPFIILTWHISGSVARSVSTREQFRLTQSNRKKKGGIVVHVLVHTFVKNRSKVSKSIEPRNRLKAA